MIRLSKKELLGKNIWQQFPQAMHKTFYHAYHKALQQQQNLVVEDYSQALGKWTQAAIYPSPDGISIYFHDVTEQRLAEKEVRKGERRYRQLLDRITDGFIALDRDFHYTYVNKKIGELVQRTPQSLLGKNVWEEFPEAVGSYTYRAFHTAMKEQRFVSNVDYFEPLDLWQENYIYPSPNGLSVIIRDVTEQKKLEQELKTKERHQQQQLIAASLEAQERERTHIGRELHDNVGQLLTAAKLILEQMTHQPMMMHDYLNRGLFNLTKAISENRKLAHEFVTPYFAGHNFGEELFQLLHSMLANKVDQIVFDASDGATNALSENIRLTIYRITQEQCTNIIKYADAKTVWFRLDKSKAGIKLEIRDDGKGMTQGRTDGIGLKNIEARLALLNGTLSVCSNPGAGFSLQVHIPCEGDVD